MRKLKHSGIQWLGDIPSHWDIIKVKKMATIKSGDMISKDEYIDNGIYNIIGSNGIIGKTNKKNNNNTVLTTGRVGSIGTVHMVKEAWITDNALILNVFENTNIRFLYYIIPNFDFEFISTGTAQPLITSSNLKEQFAPLPPLEEQKAIADFLDTQCGEVSALVEDIQKQVATLEEYKRSIVTETVTKGLNPNATMKHSGIDWIGEIPSHWKIDNPKYHFKQRKEKAYDGLVQLTASQKYGVITQEEYMQITGSKIVTVEKDFNILKLVCPGDFVIHMRSFQGGLEYSEKLGSISSAYVMLIPQKTILEPRYYKWFFKSSVYIDALSSTSNLIRDGQAMRYANFIQLPIILMPKEEQEAIAEYLDGKVSEIDALVAEKQQQVATLEEYKKSLIFEYVTGKKEVTP